MEILDINYIDLDEINKLQPEGWSSIVTKFDYYIKKEFCYPKKIMIDDEIVAIGATNIFKESAWISHVIVKENYRGNGIGKELLNSLITDLKNKGIKSINLLASEMGYPLYKKLGFDDVCNYVFYGRESIIEDYEISKNVRDYNEKFYDEILKLDLYVSGEDRTDLLIDHLQFVKLFIENGKLLGVYFPTLGEGPILAIDDFAAEELMKLRMLKNNIFKFPKDNLVASKFLGKFGFKKNFEMVRMVYGKKGEFKPNYLYNRIGGNLG